MFKTDNATWGTNWHNRFSWCFKKLTNMRPLIFGSSEVLLEHYFNFLKKLILFLFCLSSFSKRKVWSTVDAQHCGIDPFYNPIYQHRYLDSGGHILCIVLSHNSTNRFILGSKPLRSDIGEWVQVIFLLTCYRPKHPFNIYFER